MDEKELILKVRAGQKEVFGELVTRYQKRIFYTVFRLLRDYEEAQDVTQEAFILAYQAIKGFRLRCSFYTWLYRIAINLCYHRLRSRDYKVKLKTESITQSIETEETITHPKEITSTFQDPYQEALNKEQRELVYKALSSLKRKFYQVIVLHDLEGLSYKQIVQIQNCSLGTVMSRLHRARLQLFKKIKNLTEG